MKKRTMLLTVILLIAVTAVAAFVFLGQKSSGITNLSNIIFSKEPPDTPVDPNVVSAHSDFGFRLFHELNKQQPNSNVFISPASLNLTLSMTCNGARGDTQEAMARTLGIQAIPLEQVNKANSTLIANLNAPGPGLKITVANSLWGDRSIRFNRSFVATNKQYYDAHLKRLNFQDPKAPQVIDNWVSKKTQGRIKRIVERIDANEFLILVDAVHFDGVWMNEFNEALTKEGDFILSNGQKKRIPMMSNSTMLRYYRGQDFQMVRLPYGQDRMSMLIFLPDKNSDLETFISKLNIENWQKWRNGMQESQVLITMPRFEIEYSAEEEMKTALTSLGMGVAFDAKNADFTGICSQGSWLNRVIHKTYLRVDEKGTEAAAATAAALQGLAVMPSLVEFTVDRPFFCAIDDGKTGEILFMGAIYKPM
ncbi:MAG TPA: serpin family protein [Armatimonadota bacterium]|nr:serpin family protein [Armatimonadota bacterium]